LHLQPKISICFGMYVEDSAIHATLPNVLLIRRFEKIESKKQARIIFILHTGPVRMGLPCIV